MGLFSKKPKSIIVQKPPVKPAPPRAADAPEVAKTDAPLPPVHEAVHEAIHEAAHDPVREPGHEVSHGALHEIDQDIVRDIVHDVVHHPGPEAPKLAAPIKVVSERLGHSTPGFTMATYQHVIPGMQGEAAQTFAGPLAGCAG